MGALAVAAKHGLLRSGHYRRALARDAFPGVAVLCYHGVRSEWSQPRFPFDYLHVPARTFESHCRIIRECCDPISLDDWRAAVNGGPPLPRRPVLITFDDGYRSVLTKGAPILAAYELPAVVFVCTGPMASSRLLWFDIVGAEQGEEAVEALKACDYETWEAAACVEFSPLVEDDPRALMLPAELATLAQMDRIEIGGHTSRHPILARASARQQREEIRQNLQAIEAWTGRHVRAFAYPNGRPAIDYTAETSTILADAGIDIAFTTRPAFATRLEPPLERSRFLVLDNLTDAELAHRLTYSWPR